MNAKAIAEILTAREVSCAAIGLLFLALIWARFCMHRAKHWRGEHAVMVRRAEWYRRLVQDLPVAPIDTHEERSSARLICIRCGGAIRIEREEHFAKPAGQA